MTAARTNLRSRVVSPAVLWAVAAAAWVASVAGCTSATKQIGAAVGSVDRSAEHIEQLMDDGIAAAQEAADPIPFMVEASSEASTIRELAGDVRSRLPDVQDRTPWWAMLLSRWGLVLLILACLAAAVYALNFTPIGAAANKIIGWAVSLIPSPTTRRAQMDAKATAHDPTPQHRETIAASRAASPVYEAAYRRSRKQQETRS